MGNIKLINVTRITVCSSKRTDVTKEATQVSNNLLTLRVTQQEYQWKFCSQKKSDTKQLKRD